MLFYALRFWTLSCTWRSQSYGHTQLMQRRRQRLRYDYKRKVSGRRTGGLSACCQKKKNCLCNMLQVLPSFRCGTYPFAMLQIAILMGYKKRAIAQLPLCPIQLQLQLQRGVCVINSNKPWKIYLPFGQFLFFSFHFFCLAFDLSNFLLLS